MPKAGLRNLADIIDFHESEGKLPVTHGKISQGESIRCVTGGLSGGCGIRCPLPRSKRHQSADSGTNSLSKAVNFTRAVSMNLAAQSKQ